MEDLSHIKLIEFEEVLGPYCRPKVALFNVNFLSEEEAKYHIASGEYNSNIIVMEKKQWLAIFKNQQV